MTSSCYNKEEALKCLEVAKKALEDGDRDKSKRFALKAQRIYDCPEVGIFFKNLNNSENKNNQNGATNNVNSNGPSLRQRQFTGNSNNSNLGTPEQRKLIEKIKQAKTYYEVLNIEKDANEEDIKKAYKKLALKLHPDKNKAPGAEEAFKSVSRAFSCLSDRQKRSNYDNFGNEEGPVPIQNNSYYHGEEIDPHEIFNMFFNGSFGGGGGGPGVRVYTNFGPGFYHHRPNYGRRPNRQQQQEQQISSWQLFVSLFPLMIFLLFAFIPMGHHEAPYSLNNEYGYSHVIHTKSRNVPFYVKSKTKFNKQYPDGSFPRKHLENDVEMRFREILYQYCRQETVHKQRLHFWSPKDVETYKTPHCDLFEEYFPSNIKRDIVK